MDRWPGNDKVEVILGETQPLHFWASCYDSKTLVVKNHPLGKRKHEDPTTAAPYCFTSCATSQVELLQSWPSSTSRRTWCFFLRWGEKQGEQWGFGVVSCWWYNLLNPLVSWVGVKAEVEPVRLWALKTTSHQSESHLQNKVNSSKI